MKKIYIQLAIVILLVLFSQLSFSVTPGWTVKFEPEKVFILNKGQFNISPTQGFNHEVKYAYNGQDQKFYFTPSGVVLQILEIKKSKIKEGEKEKEEREAKERAKNGNGITAAEHARKEQEESRLVVNKDELRAQWIGANPNVQIIAEGQHSAYYSFSFNDENGKPVNENFVPGFDKITYKDLYPNIDVVYEMHGDEGIKYSVVVHPGGDISQVKLQYSKKARLLADGDIKTKSRFGDFTDHAPSTFYQDTKAAVASSYILTGNVISFSLGNYDLTKTIIIDPWTQTPNFAGSGGWQCVWECQKDAAANVYIIGGVTPMQLQKYNSTGTLQWTYNTPYDTSAWLGTFAVDNAGNSYVTQGSAAAMIKVSTAGGLLWSNPSPGGLFSLTEWWCISFNCDQTQLITGGTGGTAFGGPQPFIYNINMSTGNVLNSAQVTGGGLFLPQEVRAITACGNGNYYFLTHDSIGYIHQGLTLCTTGTSFPFHTYNTYNLSYKCETFRVNNTGIKAIKSFGGYIFTHRGNQVHKRPFGTGLITGTAAIPGGGFSTGQVNNSGIDVDSCGHVFVGSVNQVVEYDVNLNQLAVFPTSSNFNVYDVQVSPNGNVIAAGSTGNQNSGPRTGYVETFAAAACPTIAIVCCDASICPVSPLCISAAPFNLTAGTTGGVWSGTGITNAANGTFSPAVSGVGTFTVYYTLACGRDSTVITVNSCTSTSVCVNSNGSLTVSGGTGPYNWYVWDSIGQVCQGGISFGGQCLGGTLVDTFGWALKGTGVTFTPSAPTDTVKVVDNAGTTVIIDNISTLPLCSGCSLVIDGISSTPPTCGASNGTATVNVTSGSGTPPYHYLWSAGAADTFATVTGLGTGTFTVTVTDAGGCSATATVTFNPIAGNISLVVDTVPAYCGQSDGRAYVTASGGTPVYTYAWSAGGSTTDSAVNLAANTYQVTVTDANHCSATASATIRAAAGVVISLVAKQDVTCFGDTNGIINVTASGGVGPYTYVWSPSVSTTTSAVNLRPGNYTIVAHDANNCTSSLPVTVNQPGAVTVTTTTTQATCGGSDGTATATMVGGVGSPSYQWSSGTSPTSATDNGLPAGAYTVTITDGNGCTAVGAAGVSNIGAPTVVIAGQINVKCNGGNTGAILLGVTGGTPPYTYAWSPNATLTLDSAAAGLSAGVYSATVSDGSACIAVAVATITQPQALSASMISVNSACGTNNGWAKVSAFGGTGSYTYTWSVAQTTDSIVGLAGGKYYVTVTDGAGCTYADSVTVGTNNGPTAPVITGGPLSFCQGGSVTLTSSATTGNLWSNTANTQSITVSTAGTYTVTQTVGGCTSPPSAPVVVTVNPIPPAPTITPSGPTTFCSGGSVTLTSSASSGNLWSDNQTTQSIVVTTAGTYTVSDTVSGCPSPPSAPIAVSITVPQPVIVPSQRSFCPGTSSVTLDATTANATSYLWSNASTQPSITITSPGFYEVTVTVNGCPGTDTITINSELPLGTLPPLDSSTICRGDTVMLNATTINATSYIWSGPGFSSNSPIVVLDSGGVYSVTVSNNCGSATGSTTITLIDCNCRIVMPNAFTPNGDGINDYFGPNFDCNNPISLTMRIFNRWGEKVFETYDLYGQWDGTYKDVMQPAGVYLYYVDFTGQVNNADDSFKLMGSLTLIR